MRVLVVDDEKMVADTLVMILQQAGHEAAATYSGESALQLIESFLPGYVICDVIMPGMNGVDVCTAIHAKHPSSHILLFSGRGDAIALLQEAHEKGCTWELLAKPANPDELLAKLAAVEASTRSRTATDG